MPKELRVCGVTVTLTPTEYQKLSELSRLENVTRPEVVRILLHHAPINGKQSPRKESSNGTT